MGIIVFWSSLKLKKIERKMSEFIPVGLVEKVEQLASSFRCRLDQLPTKYLVLLLQVSLNEL